MVDPRLIAAVGDLIARYERPDHTPLIAVAGAQGSGKSTLADAAAEALSAVRLSLDDHYLGGPARRELAAAVHPLFATRGPPGTHDIAGLRSSIAALSALQPGGSVVLPVFDKLADEPSTQSRRIDRPPRAILVEGWCLGARPQPEAALATPFNDLEREEDSNGVWRRAVNARLADDYAALFAGFDAVLFLRAPGFEPVLDWRGEQEEGLLGLPRGSLPDARRAELARFIQQYERITCHMLDGGVDAEIVVDLDADRRVRHIANGGAR